MSDELKKESEKLFAQAQETMKKEAEAVFRAGEELLKQTDASNYRPLWLDINDKGRNANAPILAESVIEEYGLFKSPQGIFDRNGNRQDDLSLAKILREKIGLYIPERAANIAKYNVLPILLDRIPEQAVNIENDGVAAYITNRMKTEINDFTRAGGISTGFAELDKKTRGLYPGLYVIGAVSSLGKTTLIHQIADNIAANGKHVLFFSLEMSRLEMVSKSIARKMAQIDMNNAISSIKIRNGITTRLSEQATQLYINSVEDRLSIIEGSFDTSVNYIGEYAQRYQEKHGEQPVIIVDYLQVLQGAPKGTTKEAVDYNIVELKRLSRALRVPVIVISSVNRANYLTPMTFESFKESGNVEYTSDIVLGLQLACMDEELFAKDKDIVKKRKRIKEALAENPRKVSVICLKNRYGRTDWKVNFDYYTANDLLEENNSWTEVKNEDLPIFG